MTAFLDNDDVWVQRLNRMPSAYPRSALFLDRDGVVIEEEGYISDPDAVVLTPGAAEAIRQTNQAGHPVVLVTNQGGIALGKYGFDAFVAVQERMLDLLASADAHINLVCASPHHQRATGAYGHPNHPSRKPNPGMLLKAQERLSIDMPSSWIVGDRHTDLEAGKRAGIKGGIHVLTGHGAEGNERDLASAVGSADFQALGAVNLAEAVDLIPFLHTV